MGSPFYPDICHREVRMACRGDPRKGMRDSSVIVDCFAALRLAMTIQLQPNLYVISLDNSAAQAAM